ncbi:MAG: hypothetical protein EBT06_13785, partial [Gammaproteobacteria bacterium]|nr:hypothetical protein [Gammaproteobacteria bacterium]
RHHQAAHRSYPLNPSLKSGRKKGRLIKPRERLRLDGSGESITIDKRTDKISGGISPRFLLHRIDFAPLHPLSHPIGTWMLNQPYPSPLSSGWTTPSIH